MPEILWPKSKKKRKALGWLIVFSGLAVVAVVLGVFVLVRIDNQRKDARAQVMFDNIVKQTSYASEQGKWKDQIQKWLAYWPEARTVRQKVQTAEVLGDLYNLSNQPQEGMVWLKKAEKLAPNDYGVVKGIQQSARISGDKATEITYLKKLVSMIGKVPEATVMEKKDRLEERIRKLGGTP